VGSVGRLVAEKGFHELFQAAQKLSERNRSLHFVVVGPAEPDQNDAVPQRLVDELTRSGTVEFPGWGDDMRAWYGRMDMFVLASHREGIPRACMEAAAMGLPVVATDIRGCREVVKNGETGLLVPVRDPKALVRAIETLGADAALRRRMGAAGREHIVNNFQQRQVLDRLCAFYRDIEAGLGRKAAHA
jgi:glycosyltransferase involved in cell wall biosynthesis